MTKRFKKLRYGEPEQLTSPHLCVKEVYKWPGGSMSRERATKMLRHAALRVSRDASPEVVGHWDNESAANAVMCMNIARSHIQIELDEEARKCNAKPSAKARKR